MLEGKGAPGRLQLYVDGKLVGETDVPYTTPMILNPGALDLRREPRFVDHSRLLGRRSPSPERSTPSPST